MSATLAYATRVVQGVLARDVAQDRVGCEAAAWRLNDLHTYPSRRLRGLAERLIVDYIDLALAGT